MREQSSRRGVPGSVPLSRQREEYARLIARGVSNAEACRVVGVNRRTGTRWRYGRTIPARDGSQRHYPGVVHSADAPARSPRYLSEQEREVVADGLRAKDSMRAIARELGRDVSTVSRELARNRDEQGRYRPAAAQRMATARLARPRDRKVGQWGPVAEQAGAGLVGPEVEPGADQRSAAHRVPERPGTPSELVKLSV